MENLYLEDFEDFLSSDNISMLCIFNNPSNQCPLSSITASPSCMDLASPTPSPPSSLPPSPSPTLSSLSSSTSIGDIASLSNSISKQVILASLASAFPISSDVSPSATSPSSTASSFDTLIKHDKLHADDITDTNNPYLYPTNTLCEAFINNRYGGPQNLTEADLTFIRLIFQRTQMVSSHVSLPIEKVFTRLMPVEYTKHVKYMLKSMSIRAAEKAIAQFNASSDVTTDIRPHITHIVFGTMTASVHAPSMDIELVNALSLSRSVKRLNVESMGCLTGFRLVGQVSEIVESNANNVVLLIVSDVRSALGNLLSDHLPRDEDDKVIMKRLDVIVSALFRDGGGAAIFCNKDRFAKTHTFKRSLSFVNHESYLIPDSTDYAWLHASNDGSQELYLDKRIPICIHNNLPSILSPTLQKYHINKDKCLFAVHTGGPRVLDAVSLSMKLTPEQLSASWYVMLHYGNLSGSSNMIVMDYANRILNGDITQSNSVKHEKLVFPTAGECEVYTHVVGLSFGPGIGLELVLMKIERESYAKENFNQRSNITELQL